MCSVYAPNVDQVKFFNQLSGTLTHYLTGPILMGGDFNSVAGVTLDRSHPPLPDSPVHRLSKIRCDWQNRWNLLDSWRVHHPEDRDYSFFSALHELHVRLDAILCSPEVGTTIVHSEYLTRTLSDHNPLLIKLNWSQERTAIPSWRLLPETLEDPVFRREIGEGIAHYFSENEGTASTRALEWDAFKVVVRGLCITKYVGVRKTLLQDVEKAEQKLRETERARPEQPERQKEVLEAKEAMAVELERLRCFDYKKYLVKAHAECDKSGSLLAWLANPTPRGTPILALKTREGHLVYTQREINARFLDYYEDLYKSSLGVTGGDIDTFLTAVTLPQIDDDQVEQLGQDITLGEIRSAVKHMARNKTPGIDGLPVEFYSTYIDELAPRLLTVFQEAGTLGCLPASTREAIIIP